MENKGKRIIYPIGVQSFEKLRRTGCVYVDKTDFVWQLVTQPSPIFLSRPRRFGKSLMLSTIEAYFLGKKELFQGLAISRYEQDWEVFPVFHFDFNSENYQSLSDLKSLMNDYLSVYEDQYGLIPAPEATLPTRFRKLIREAHDATLKPVVILVDEYDKPLLSTINDKHLQNEISKELKSFYGVVKSLDSYIRFAMFTGVARFSKVSIFSDLNNLMDISLSEDYNSICGITETELLKYFKDPIDGVAHLYGVSFNQMLEMLKNQYDGYNFSDPSMTECLYNPFSILSCFNERKIDDYWFDSGTPSFLIRTLIKDGQDIPSLMDDVTVRADIMRGVNVPEKSPITNLYQSGYLTVKSYNRPENKYTLGFPNHEVISGFNRLAFIVYGRRDASEFDITKFLQDVNNGNPGGFMRRLKALIASVPHEQALNSEATYHNVVYLLFKLLKRDVHAECHMNNGVTDLTVATDKYVYVFEFKFNKSAGAAICQINDHKYDAPFQTGDRKVFKIGVNFSDKERNIKDWKIE